MEKEIKIKDKTYFFIEVPFDAYDFSIHISVNKHTTNDRLEFKIPAPPHQTMWGWYDKTIKLKAGKHQIISTTKDITESEAKNIIESKIYSKGLITYKDYLFLLDLPNPEGLELFDYMYARESLNSLIQANGLDIEKNYLILLKNK